jgi:putative SOS response-associated peptidase YedK
MCSLYSVTTNQEAIRSLFKVGRDLTGNLPWLPGVFPDYSAPVIHLNEGQRVSAMMRWGLPSSQKAQFDAATKRAEKLRAKTSRRLSATTPDGAGRRHDERPQHEQQALETLARA